MSSIDDYYPQACPFCKISQTYPPDLINPIPTDPDPARLDPQCHLLLSTPTVLAFLDILPMAPGHILLTTRTHYQTLTSMYLPPNDSTWTSVREAQHSTSAARALGEWMPILSTALCRVTGVEDWNIVQNNGERAAQVVPHVHFHFIPRYQEGRRVESGKGMGGVRDLQQARSWKMFGRGSREDLDDEEGRELAGRLRGALREVLEGREGGGRSKL